MDAAYLLYYPSNDSHTWEYFSPSMGTFHSQRGNNLQPYFFFFVEIWSVLVAFVEVLFREDFVFVVEVAEVEEPL